MDLRVSATTHPEHAPRDPFRVLERRHGLAEVVERFSCGTAITGLNTYYIGKASLFQNVDLETPHLADHPTRFDLDAIICSIQCEVRQAACSQKYPSYDVDVSIVMQSMGSNETATATSGGPRVIDVFGGTTIGPKLFTFFGADRPSVGIGLGSGDRLCHMR